MFFFFKQKTAYEMRISDWSSDVCSSDLADGDQGLEAGATGDLHVHGGGARAQLGAQHDLADQVEVPGVLDHGATGNHAELLTLEPEALDEPVDGRGQHLLVGGFRIDSVRAGEGDAIAADDGNAKGLCLHESLLCCSGAAHPCRWCAGMETIESEITKSGL